MRKQFEFSEEDLYLAAREAEQFIRAQYPDAQTCPPHTFSPAFEADMQQLFVQLQNGTLKPSAARLGWPYYLRRSIAAILLCFLLACVTMPEAVLAGYQKLIEVVEHVFEEYTEFRYRSDVEGDMEFKPLKLGYLPEGMELVKNEMTKTSINLLYKNAKGEYLRIYQKMMVNNIDSIYAIDNEEAKNEFLIVGQEKILFAEKTNRISFIWMHEKYHINGQTNLPKDEVIYILEKIEI